MDIVENVGRTSQTPDSKYTGIIDINNPPKLTHEHYKMLKGIDFTGRISWRKTQSEDERQEWKKKIIAMQRRTDARFQFDLKELLDLELQKKGKGHFEYDDGYDDGYDFEIEDEDPLEEQLRKLSELKERDEEHFEPIKKKKKCIFCEPDPSPNAIKTIDYTNIQLLHQFINERGMIKNRRVTNNCMKHQKKIRLAIQRARQIGLLSFISDWSPPHPSTAQQYGDSITDQFDEEFGAFDDDIDFDAPDFNQRVMDFHNTPKKEELMNFNNKPEIFETDVYRKKKERQRELRGASHKRKQKNPKDMPGAKEMAEYLRAHDDEYSRKQY